MKKNPQQPLMDDESIRLFVKTLIELLESFKSSQSEEAEYYDNADLKRLFNLSDSTLSRLRKSQKLEYIKIGGKIFYPKSFFNPKTFRK